MLHPVFVKSLNQIFFLKVHNEWGKVKKLIPQKQQPLNVISSQYPALSRASVRNKEKSNVTFNKWDRKMVKSWPITGMKMNKSSTYGQGKEDWELRLGNFFGVIFYQLVQWGHFCTCQKKLSDIFGHWHVTRAALHYVEINECNLKTRSDILQGQALFRGVEQLLIREKNNKKKEINAISPE